MIATESRHQIIDALARDPLRHVVLLKYLMAYPGHTTARRVTGPQGAATLVAMETGASAYDLKTYPGTRIVAFIESDHPDLTAVLLDHLPRDAGIVFKLSRPEDVAVVAARFAVARRRGFVSFTAADSSAPEPEIRATTVLSDAAYRLFATQDHARDWLEPLLAAGTAFACVLERDGRPLSACFAFQNYGPVWEIGGVITDPDHRRNGHAARAVRAALAEIGRRGLVPRYQVEDTNAASIGLARSIGLRPFMTLAHYVHEG
jgi:RimJ/RimL family protein N-acetyltransferase